MEFRDKLFQYIKKYSYISLVFITIIFACILNPNLFETKKECIIQLSADYDETVTHGQQVWLTQILINNENIPLSDLDIVNNDNWEYAADCDDYVFYSSAEIKDNILEFCIEDASDVDLVFITSNWSGSVGVITEKKSSNIDLYSDEIGRTTYQISEDDFKTLYWNTIIPLLGIVILVVILVSEVMLILKNSSVSGKLIGICELLSFDILRRYDLLNGLTIFLLLSCIGFLIYRNKYHTENVYPQNILIKLLLHIYFIFAMIGNRLFMTNPLMNFGLLEVISFIIITLALWPFGTLLLLIFNKCTLHLSEGKEELIYDQIKKLRVISFLITFSILIIMSLAFYPAIMSTDGVSHWLQAIGYDKIQNNHPAAFVLLIRLCSQIWNSPYCFILLQLVLFSLISSRLMTHFFIKGLSFKLICCLSATIAILPNNYMTLSTLSKNPMYTIFCIWVTYLLIELIDDFEKTGMSVKFIIEMSVILPCLYLCRYNSFIAVYGICIVLIVSNIKFSKCVKKIKLNFVIPIFVMIIVVKIVTGPIYSYFGVQTYNSSGVAYPLISPLAVAYNNGVNLTEDTLEYMNRIRPLEFWNQHIPYHGDYFNSSQPKPQYDQINGYTEKFRYYFNLLFSRPDIVIKDRLDGIESLWNVFPSKGQGAYNERYHLGIHSSMPKNLLPTKWNISDLNRWNAYFNETDFTTIPYALCQFCEANTMLDALIWRVGFSMILVFYAIYYAYTKGQRKKIIAAIPMLGTLISLILPISWQIYQYFWVIHITNWFLIIYFILPDSKRTNKKTVN